MNTKQVSSGTLHKLPSDLKKALVSDKKVLLAWEDITPLARNEWICWVEQAKKEDTRERRITRAKQELAEGARRPCCWPGCPHHRPSAKKWFSNKKESS